MAGRRKDDEAILRTMADMIVGGQIDVPKRGKSAGVQRAAELVAAALGQPLRQGQKDDPGPEVVLSAFIERIRKAYRENCDQLESAARERYGVKVGNSIIQIYRKHDKEVARERAEALDYLVNDIYSDHIRHARELKHAASSVDRDGKMDELAEELEELARALRQFQAHWGSS